jgi:hypothetical protein
MPCIDVQLRNLYTRLRQQYYHLCPASEDKMRMGWRATSEDFLQPKHVSNCASNNGYSRPCLTDCRIYTRVFVTEYNGMFRLKIRGVWPVTWLAIHRSWILPSNNPHRFLVCGSQVVIHKSFHYILKKYFSWYSITAVYVIRNRQKSGKKQTIGAKREKSVEITTSQHIALVYVKDTYTILMWKHDDMRKIDSPLCISKNNKMNLKRVSHKNVKVDSSGSEQDILAYCLKHSNDSKVVNIMEWKDLNSAVDC